jgi:hypothetical protein
METTSSITATVPTRVVEASGTSRSLPKEIGTLLVQYFAKETDAYLLARAAK